MYDQFSTDRLSPCERVQPSEEQRPVNAIMLGLQKARPSSTDLSRVVKPPRTVRFASDVPPSSAAAQSARAYQSSLATNQRREIEDHIRRNGVLADQLQEGRAAMDRVKIEKRREVEGHIRRNATLNRRAAEIALDYQRVVEENRELKAEQARQQARASAATTTVAVDPRAAVEMVGAENRTLKQENKELCNQIREAKDIIAKFAPLSPRTQPSSRLRRGQGTGANAGGRGAIHRGRAKQAEQAAQQRRPPAMDAARHLVAVAAAAAPTPARAGQQGPSEEQPRLADRTASLAAATVPAASHGVAPLAAVA